jgi:PAS domain S-box-containing protein
VPGSNLANLTAARVSRAIPDLEPELLNALGDAVIATDINGYIIFWNRAAEWLYGWTADEVTGRNILDVTPNKQSRALAAAIFDRLAKGETWSGEFETRHKDGHTLLVTVNDYPVRDQSGQLIAIVGVSRALDDTGKTPSRLPGDGQFLSRALGRIRSAILQLDGHVELPHLLRGFAMAVVLYGLALAARVLLDEIVPDRLPFITFFPAILIAALVCGLWPTLALLFVCALTGAFWGQPSLGDIGSFRIWAGILFVVVGALVIAPVIYANAIRERLRQRDEQVTLLNRELKHRLKNLLAVTSSICQQTVKSDLPRESLAAVITGRLKAVALAQDLLDAAAEQGSDLRALVEAVVRPLSPDPSRLDVQGPAVSLPAEVMVPFALILHELATNALKYGAWASSGGRTIIRWQQRPRQQLEFRWREEGGSIVSAAQREGFGSMVIKRALNQAKVQHQIAPQGADCLIELTI